jgi:iron complex outermembrane receptor protein
MEAAWQVSPPWRVSGGYTLLREHLRVTPGRVDRNDAQGETFDPEQQFQLRSSLDLRPAIEFDVWARYVGEVGTTGRGFGVVPEYVTVDARIGWSLVPSLQLAIVGQNLLADRHREFGSREIPRAVYTKVSWRR